MVGILPQLQVLAAGLLPDAGRRFVEKRKESRNLFSNESHADDADKHINKGIRLR